jgi:hypothetical protein
VILERISPDYILVSVEISVKDLAYLVAVDVISINQLDQCVGFVERQSRNLPICRATTVTVERDPDYVHPPIRIDIEIGEDATALQAKAKAAWPGSCRPNVFRDLQRHPPSQAIDPPHADAMRSLANQGLGRPG